MSDTSTTIDKLNKLIGICKGTVYITVNEHRNAYLSIEEHLRDLDKQNEEINADVRKQIILQDTLIGIQFYPATPIGFYCIYHYDLGLAIDAALASLGESNVGT